MCLRLEGTSFFYATVYNRREMWGNVLVSYEEMCIFAE